jgi:TrmH family RNA methyltransferase
MRYEDRETPRTVSIKRAVKLQQKKHREIEELFLAEGRTLIEESPERPRQIFKEKDNVRRLSTLTTTTGPVGVFPFLDVSGRELLASCDRIVLLHGVQDPGNVGTIIRAAHAFGAGVALSGGCADLYNPKTVRATMGSIFHAPVAREVGSLKFLESARGSDFMTVAAVLGGGSIPKVMPSDKLVVVIGSEGAGLPEEVVAACEQHVKIPSQASSLNAAMAASILLYEAYMRVLP